MRTFETLMLLSALFVVVVLASRVQKKAHLVGSSAILALMFFAHIFIEGVRWQFSIAYTLIAILIFASVKKIFSSQSIQKRSSIGWAIPGTIIILITASLAIILPVFELPAPTGPHAVGTKTFHWIDTDRPEYYTQDLDDVREIMVQFWYPTEKDESLQTASYWGEHGKTMGALLAKHQGFPSFAGGHFRLATTHSFGNAQLSNAKKRYPVILISHGKNSFRAEFTSLAEEFASHGFIAVTIDHPFEAMATVFPNGKVVQFAERPDEWFTKQFTPDSLIKGDSFNIGALYQVRRDDIQCVIDELQKFESLSDSKFHKKIDYENIGMCGHSRGGTTAVLACQKEERLSVGISFDGQPAGVKFDTSPTRAFMYLNVNHDKRRKAQSLEREKKSLDDACNELEDRCYLIKISGITHSSFSDAIFFTPLKSLTDAGELEPKVTNALIRKYSLAFFQHYLAGEENRLLDQNFVNSEHIKLLQCSKNIEK